MARVSEPHRHATSRLTLRAHEQQVAAALHHLRQRWTTASRTLIGRLLYDTKMIFEDQLAALEADSQEGRHPGRRHRLRPAGRRPGGRARAGHHHRRRLSLLLDRAAQVHRRRHAGPRAVHPQHGHRRLDRRRRRHPGRCAQGRADADAAAQLSWSRCSASGTWCWPSTRWIWSATTEKTFDAHRRATTAPSPRSSGSRTSRAIPISGAARRQHHRASDACPGTAARR